MQHLQKQGGGGVLWLTSTLLTLTFGRSDVRTCQRFNALFIRSFRSLLDEHLPTHLHSQGSSLFLKTAGWYPNSSHSGTRHSPQYSSSIFSHACALFCTFLHSRKSQPFSSQAVAHSLQKTTGGGGGASPIAHPPLCEISAHSASQRYLFTACHSSACPDRVGALNPSFSFDFQLSTFNPHLLPPLNSPRKCNLLMAIPEAEIDPRMGHGYLQSRHGKRHQRSKPPGNAAGRLPVRLRLQHQPQNHRPAILVACALQRFPRHGHVAAHAHPPGVAGNASPVPLQPRQLAGAFCRAHHAPRFTNGFSGAHRGAPGQLRKLFSSTANRRARNGFPHAEPSRALGHSRLALRADDDVFPFPAIRHHTLDRQRRHLLRRVASQRAQFQRHHHRSARPRHDPPPASLNRLGLVHQRHPRHADFQHSPGGVCLLALGSPFEHALFSCNEFHCQSAVRCRRECCSRSLAAPL